jgi:ABC-type transport system involved in cytochrome bd biosynthesis fused ATPase/permease subunit
MKDPDSNDGRLTNLARRWRKRLTQAKPEADSQELFFSPPSPPKGSSDSAPTDAEPAVPTAVEDLPTDPELTTDQAKALRQIEAAYEPGGFYLLTGHAGSGKSISCSD